MTKTTRSGSGSQESAARTTRLLREKEVMEVTSLCRGTLWRLVKQGDLEVVRIGRAVRYTEDSVNRLIRNGARLEPVVAKAYGLGLPEDDPSLVAVIPPAFLD